MALRHFAVLWNGQINTLKHFAGVKQYVEQPSNPMPANSRHNTSPIDVTVTPATNTAAQHATLALS